MIELIQKYLSNTAERYPERMLWWDKNVMKMNEVWLKHKDLFISMKEILLHEFIVKYAENKNDVEKFKWWIEAIPQFLESLQWYIDLSKEEKEFVRKY